MSRHEAEIDRAAARGCIEAFRHPSQLPTLFRNIFTSTRAYYRAEDTIDLERGELIKLVSWTRKMAIKLTASSLLLGLIVILALLKTCHAETQWTPDDFDWETLAPVPNNAALYLNLTANPQGTLPHHGALIEAGASDILGNSLVFFIPFSLGLAWQALQVAVTLAGTATAIYGCITSGKSSGAGPHIFHSDYH
jgi:VIT1/CCC1 family predicted Fe2+/Mn2+ transporter